MKKSELQQIIKEEVGNTLSEKKITFPKEIQDILNSLMSLGIKKYQLSVGKLQGVYVVELPMTIVNVNTLSKILEVLPKDSSIGLFPGYSGLTVKTNVKTQ